MQTATSAPAGPTSRNLVKRIGLMAALAALMAIVWMTAAQGLPRAGQVMLGILAFAVIVWMTEALDYAVSAVVIGALRIFLLAFAPAGTQNGGTGMVTGAALSLALSGFSSSAVALVAAPCFIAAAMTVSGLDRRIALVVLSRVDARTNHIVIGAMAVGFLLSFIVPSTTARVACLMPIMNVGIKSATAQNMVAVDFVEKQFGTTITWTE